MEDDWNLNFAGSCTEARPWVECFWKWDNYSCKFRLSCRDGSSETLASWFWPCVQVLLPTIDCKVRQFVFTSSAKSIIRVLDFDRRNYAQVHTISYVFGVRTVVAPGMLVALGGPLREKWLYAQPRDEETSEMARQSKDNGFKLALWEATRRYRRSS